MPSTPTIDVETSTQGGIMRGLRRSVLGGESFFMNTFSATGPNAHVVVAPALPGDIITWPLTGKLAQQFVHGVTAVHLPLHQRFVH